MKQTELSKSIEAWLSTWAANCGAPKAVFVGQFRNLADEILKEVETYEGIYCNYFHDQILGDIDDAIRRLE